MIRLGYFADGPWSHRALERIVPDDRFKILFIVPRYTSQDPVLRGWADKLGVPFLPLENVNTPESIAKLNAFGADLFVSMSFDQILKAPILAATPMGFINCHAGALPFYRGRNVLNWVLINDEREFGVTVHQIDGGIDTGNILVQRMLPITEADTYATLLPRAAEACAETLHETLIQLDEKRVHPKPQRDIHPVGSYFGRRRPGDEWIDWQWPSRRIHNFVRAITPPGPGAMTLVEGRPIRILASRMIDGAPMYIATCGEVVGTSVEGVVVKTGDTTLLIAAWEPMNEPPLRLRVGHRLGGRL